MNDEAPSQRGFTIIETLIVVAIMGFMLSVAVLLVAGQQRKVEFTQAVQEIRSAIEQVITETAAGYYPNAGNVQCAVSGGALSISTGAGTAQGSNTGCVFLGKAMQFGVSGTDPQEYVTHIVAGLQDNQGTLATAKPTAVDIAGTRVTGTLRNGLRAISMKYVVGAAKTDIGAVAFLNGLGSYNGGQLVSGTQQMMLVPVTSSGTVPNTTVPGVVSAINTQLKNADSLINPADGVQICFQSAGTNQSGLITIGSSGRNLSVKLDIKSTTDCT
jgi:prepilin-type N-terminal cleavage/methylation domain-containing protein